jgi:probable phosphoglycerate mutase
VLAIRHGESEWNAEGRWQGQSDPPLTERGRRQARAAGAALATGERFEVIVGSDLQRARVTAAIIGDIIGTEVAYLDHRLRENRAGEWEGLNRVQIEAAWPGYLDVEARPPGFEPAEHTVARMEQAFADLAALVPGANALVIGHSGAIRSLRRAHGGEDFRIPNLAGFWFEVGDGEIRPGDVVELLDAAADIIE